MGKKEPLKLNNNKQSDLEDRIFSFKRINADRGIKISFPKILASDLKMKTSLPTFRKDKLFFTEAFSLPDQLHHAQQEKSLVKFKEKLQKINETSYIGVVVPKEKNNFCSVCKQRFEDYEQHINEEEHRLKQGSSPFNKYIQELTENYFGTEIAGLKIGSKSEQKDEELTSSGGSQLKYEEDQMQEQK